MTTFWEIRKFLFVKIILWKKSYPEELSYEQLADREIFESIYEQNSQNWKERTYIQKTVIFQEYVVVKVNKIIVGWYSLVDSEINWTKAKVLECLFSNKKWVWEMIWEKIKEQNLIFAYAQIENKWFFEKIWFTQVEWKYSESWADLYQYKKYLTKKKLW